MIGSSVTAGGPSPVALALAAASKKEPEKAQEPTALTETKPEPVTAGKKSGGYLASFDVENVLHLNSEPPIDLSTLKKGLSEKEWLGEAIKRSKAAYAAGGASATNLGSYTQKDVDTIRAATGYNVVVIDGGSCVVDDNGNPAPESAGRNIQHLLGDIEGDRSIGNLKGEMTPDYLKAEFAKYADAAKSDKTLSALPDEWLTKALDYLSGSSSSKGVDTHA